MSGDVGQIKREFIHINMLYPALFTALWICIFSGSSLYFDALGDGSLNRVLNEQGVEHVFFQVFQSEGHGFEVEQFLFLAAKWCLSLIMMWQKFCMKMKNPISPPKKQANPKNACLFLRLEYNRFRNYHITFNCLND